MRLSQREATAIIAGLERIDEERQRILDILFPEMDGDESDACPHPADQVEDRSTLGNELYHCCACGADFTQDPSCTTPNTTQE